MPEGAVRLGSPRFLLPSGITSIAFARDGKSFFMAPWLPYLELKRRPIVQMDMASGKVLQRFGSYNHAILAASPDGKIVAAWTDWGLELWDSETGKRIRRNEVGQRTPMALAFSPDGTMIFAAAEGYGKVLIRRFMVPSTRELEPWDARAGSVKAVAFSADGRSLLAACSDRIRAWDVHTGKMIQQARYPKDVKIWHDSRVSLSRDGSLVFASHYAGPTLSPKDWKKVTDRSGFPAAGVFSADGKMLATGGANDPICLWDPASGELIRRFAAAADNGRNVLGFSPDGKVLVSAQHTRDHLGPNRLRFWDVATGNEIRPYDGHAAPLTVLAHSPDGRHIASADAEGTIVLWNRDGSRVWQQHVGKESASVASLAFATDGESVVAAAGNTVVSLDVEKHGARQAWTVPTKANVRLSLSRDGEMVVLSDNESVEIWAVTNREKLRTINCGHHSLARFSQAGDVLATGGHEKGVKLWYVPSGRLLANVGNDPCFSLTFSRDGRILATSEGDKAFDSKVEPSVRLWEVATGQPISSLEGIRVIPQVLTFSPDGHTLLHTCWSRWGLGGESLRERGAILRDIAGFDDLQQVTGSEFAAVCLTSGESLRPLPGRSGRITCASWSPDGKSVVTGSTDGTLLVWDASKFMQTCERKQRLSSDDCAQLWEDLASADAGRAYRAIARLAVDPEAAIPLLKKQLRAEMAPNPKHVARLLTDLDNDQFAIRKSASDELEKLGELVTVALKEAAARKSSLEFTQRVDLLYEKSLTAHLRPEKLRNLRTLLVLERIGTLEARELLQAIAAGSAAARLTKDARAALER